MKIRHLLALASVSAAVASASAFEWSPAIQQPNPSFDVTQVFQLETLRINADADLVATDVVPKWVDENGTEISGTYSSSSDPSWGEYSYDFHFSDFKCNGEYTLQFPEGMLKNAAGELSDPKEFYYTVEIPDLASAMFDDFEILSVSPDFSQPQSLWENQLVTINTNHNEAIGYTELLIFDNTTNQSVTISYTNEHKLGSASAISWEVVGSFKFFEGHDYSAEFVFYNGIDKMSDGGVPTPVVARETYNFTGKVAGYKYSDITLLSITPDTDILISEPSQAVFTYTFSGPVNVYKAESPQGLFGVTTFPESCLSSNEEKTVWTLDLSDNEYVKTVDAELAIAIYVRDMDGYQLHGDFGDEGESCFTAAWQCDLGGFPIVVVSPVNGSSVEGVSEIVVKSESGSPMSWAWQGEIHVRNQFDEELGTLFYEVPEGDGDSALEEYHFTQMIDASWSRVSLNELTDGFYSLYFDPGCFNMGDQFESKKSRSLTSSFFISGGSAVDPQEALNYTSVIPEVQSTVKSLESILIQFAEPVACEDFEVNVFSSARNLVATGVGRSDFGEPSLIVVTLNEPVTEAGSYSVVIPARVIINGDFYESEGKEGLCNPEYTLTYTVDPEGADQPGVDPAEQEVFFYDRVSPESGSTVASLEVIKLWYPDVVDTTGKDAIVYDKADGSVVSYAQVLYNWDDDLLINVELTDPVTEAGEYEVVIPGRAICDGDFFMSDGRSGICNPEIKLTYIVDPELSAVGSVAITSNCDVYDVQGRVVLRNASAAQLKSLSKGIYVVGGKKIVIK